MKMLSEHAERSDDKIQNWPPRGNLSPWWWDKQLAFLTVRNDGPFFNDPKASTS